MNTIEMIKHAFQPVGTNRMDAGQTQRIMKIQNAAQEFAEEILDLVPECADRTHAMRLCLDAKMWCVQAIAHYGPTVAAPAPKKTVPLSTKKDPEPGAPAQENKFPPGMDADKEEH